MVHKGEVPVPFLVRTCEYIHLTVLDLLFQKADGDDCHTVVDLYGIFYGIRGALLKYGMDVKAMAHNEILKQFPGTAAGFSFYKVMSVQFIDE